MIALPSRQRKMAPTSSASATSSPLSRTKRFTLTSRSVMTLHSSPMRTESLLLPRQAVLLALMQLPLHCFSLPPHVFHCLFAHLPRLFCCTQIDQCFGKYCKVFVMTIQLSLSTIQIIYFFCNFFLMLTATEVPQTSQQNSHPAPLLDKLF